MTVESASTAQGEADRVLTWENMQIPKCSYADDEVVFVYMEKMQNMVN